MLRVRPATLDDLDTVVALRLALLREHAGNAIYGRLRADAPQRARLLFGAQIADTQRPGADEIMLLAERARGRTARVVGILRCMESHGSPLLEPTRYGYVASVYVVPAARRHGVLHLLFDEAIAWCHARGLDEIRLHSAIDNDTGNAAWDRMGFAIVEHLRVRRIGE